MKRFSGDAAFTAWLLGVTLVLLGLTLNMGASARLVPLIVVVPLAALLAYRLVRDSIGKPTPNEVVASAEGMPPVRREFLMVAWVIGLPLVASLLGFVIGPGLFVLGWMLWRSRARVFIAVTSGVLTGVGIWLLFERLLRVHFPPGVWISL